MRLRTLQYAEQAKRIKNKPTVNQDPRVAKIAASKQLGQGGSRQCPPEQSCHNQQSHTLQQVEHTKELQELNQKLSSTYIGCRKDLEDLQEEISILQKERDELTQVLQNVQNQNAEKISEQGRKRLQELEQKISELDNEITEKQKIIKMMERCDKEISRLESEIHMCLKRIHCCRIQIGQIYICHENNMFMDYMGGMSKITLQIMIYARVYISVPRANLSYWADHRWQIVKDPET